MSSKQIIGSNLKKMIWEAFFKDDVSSACLCCKKVHISKDSYHAGHIISEAKGGLALLENLVPICRDCNTKCGQKNLLEFAKEKYNNIIVPLEEHSKYIKNIEEGNDMYYNTRQLAKPNQINSIILELIIIFDINSYKEYKNTIPNRILQNYNINDIEIIKRVLNDKYYDLEIKFIIESEKIYPVKIKYKTLDLEHSTKIKCINKKYQYIYDIDIQYPMIEENNRKYVKINNRIFNWGECLQRIGQEKK